MKNRFEFTADRITVNGKTFPARYETAEDSVNIFATVTEEGKEKTVCICVKVSDPLYPAALAAVQIVDAQHTEEAQAVTDAQQAEEVQAAPDAQQAEEAQAAPDAQQAEEAQAAPDDQQAEEAQAVTDAQQAEEAQAAQDDQQTEEAQATPDAQQAEEVQAATDAQQTEEAQATPDAQQAEEVQAAPDAKAARGPIPEKTFIGQSITGAGWAIIFDGSCNRTRVIVSKGNHDKLRPIIESAGFYYSPSMGSWNRKLTFRAYRAAQALAQELKTALAA